MLTDHDTTTPEFPLDGINLADRTGLAHDPQLDDVLSALSVENYGGFSPDEGDAPLRRMWGSDELADLRSLTALARRIRARAAKAIAGSAEMAYADFTGVDLMLPVRNAVDLLASLDERDEPMRSTQLLAQLSIEMLASEWVRLGGARDPEAFAAFAKDALNGRRYFDPAILDQEIAVATGPWRVPAGEKRRHPMRYPPEGWEFVDGYEAMGGLTDDAEQLNGRALQLARNWAENCSVHIARYRYAPTGELLLIIANGAPETDVTERAAFRMEGDLATCVECEMPPGFAAMIDRVRHHGRPPVLG